MPSHWERERESERVHSTQYSSAHKVCGRARKPLLMHLICDLSADTVKTVSRKSWCSSSRNWVENGMNVVEKYTMMWEWRFMV